MLFTIARRRADIKRKKLKTLGKSKSTESEEECEEEEADEGNHDCFLSYIYIIEWILRVIKSCDFIICHQDYMSFYHNI